MIENILRSVPVSVWLFALLLGFLFEMAWRLFTNHRLQVLEATMKADRETFETISKFMDALDADVTQLEEEFVRQRDKAEETKAMIRAMARQGTRSRG